MWQQQHKFFPAQASDGVIRPRNVTESRSECAQRPVTLGMTVAIVVAFKVVHIDDQQR
jgi:hypothetical protein